MMLRSSVAREPTPWPMGSESVNCMDACLSYLLALLDVCQAGGRKRKGQLVES